MIVPEFWAEARIQKRFPDRQITVRRFGWSDVSQDEAQRHADERVREAFDRVVAGEELPRREQKVRYNGADGLPIREEIIDRFRNCVVTRNSYGARCLNTPDVFFADVDCFSSPFEGLGVCGMIIIASVIIGSAVGYQLSSIAIGVLATFIGAILISIVGERMHRMVVRGRGGREHLARRRIRRFAAAHPNWHLQIYRTPNGFRVMALHRTFDPRSVEVAAAFKALGVDRTYAVMCQKQNCFRARLTAKPWRIGIEHHLKPRPGVWPITEDRLPARRIWIDEYESSAKNYAACRFESAVGDVMTVSGEAEAVRDYHDRACGANRDVDLA